MARFPLKETDTNLQQRPTVHVNEDGVIRGGLIGKKRSLERIEIQERKKSKAERARSIEGAVKVSKSTVVRNIEAKVTPTELLEWQNNWKRIMKRESRIYFDSSEENESGKQKGKMDRKRELLKSGFLSLGAQITQFFDCSVTIVITRRSVENLHLLPESDILSRAKKGYMKVWGYEKAFRFLKNLDVDVDNLESKKTDLGAPSLSNLLQSEKLYGPTDRDPRTRRDDIHYFKYAYVYMFDLWQTWAPIIALEWKPQELKEVKKLPYPVLKIGTFGRCPFIGDASCDETSYRRVMKRYARDKANKSYALKLRRLYQFNAQPCARQQDLIFIPHTCLDSKRCFEKWKKNIAEESKEESSNVSLQKESPRLNESRQESPEKTLELKQDVKKGALAVVGLSREETEEFPDDLCQNNKKKSRINQEIKASGVHQSNDVATSFGNGLGPTTASVMNKNLKTLSRLVVDRRLGAKINHAGLGPPSQMQLCNTNDDQNSARKKKKVEVLTPANTPQTIKKETVKNAGYCENCRVKYEHLDDHITTEKHQMFAQNDYNFELIDSLIEKLKFQF
ncbi:hypothetical protein HG537_0D04550 [Torulaspora globosa]|uniref:DBF4-type domain-containing protein n=1 Tax=Torulaspora globosa TaxID=48254 RepID=A0A7H9HVI0_9SACH|nr:hypothetical protein HG537_0D04550 [Torulaspora sp. CBS 2947]